MSARRVLAAFGFVVGFLSLSPRGEAANRWEHLDSVTLPPGVTSLFRWDHETLGALDPSEGAVHLVRRSVAGGGARLQGTSVVSLEVRAIAGPVAALHPDPVVRVPGGDVYWLRRRPASLLSFRPDGIALRDQPEIYPSAFDLRSSAGRLEVAGWADGAPTAGVHRYDYDGRFVGREASWIEPLAHSNRHTAALRVPMRRGFFEIAVHYPFARWVGPDGERLVQVLESCTAQDASFRNLIKSDANRSGWPRPFGSGIKVPAPKLQVLALAATALDEDRVVAILNGGVIAVFDAEAVRVDCQELASGPRTAENGRLFTSIAVVGGDVVVLERRQSDASGVRLLLFRALPVTPR